MDTEDTRRYRLIAVRDPTMSRENAKTRESFVLGEDNANTSLDMQMDMGTQEGGTYIYE
jgi:hypothetical protein